MKKIRYRFQLLKQSALELLNAILESGIAPQVLDKITKNKLIAIVKDDIEINMKARVIDFLRRFENQEL